MGTGTSQPAPLKCDACNRHAICSICNGCYLCNPIRDCKKCLNQRKDNITANIDYLDLKDIYDNGQIEKVQAKASQISSSKLPFSKGQIHHLYLILTIRASRQKQYLILIEGVLREGGFIRDGKMEVIISSGGCLAIRQFQEVIIQNKPFKQLYNHLRNNYHEKEYDRYKKNCYHLGIDVITYLKPSVDYNQVLKPIHDYKDLQVHNFWH